MTELLLATGAGNCLHKARESLSEIFKPICKFQLENAEVVSSAFERLWL